MRTRLTRLNVTPERFRLLAYASLAALTVIVLTGAIVRLTGSGLGCPDWPKCYGKAYPPFSSHALIEFGNRMITGVVSVIVVATAVAAWLRRPYRRDLLWLSLTPLLGVAAQAALGGLVVGDRLAPGSVMAHFDLSMLILIGAVALAWASRYEPGSRPRSSDRLTVWAVRSLAPLGAVTIALGTVTTAAGPHSGGTSGQHIHRLHFKGANTLTWMVHRHATFAAVFGILVIGVWFLVRRRGTLERAVEPLTVLGVLMAAQGLVGSVQYELALPADMVWVHVTLATLTWLAVLWAVAAAGRLVPQAASVPVAEPAGAARSLEVVGRTG